MGSRKRLWKLYHQLFVVSPSISALCWPFSHVRVGGPCAIAAQLVAMPLAAQELQLGDGECTRSGECRPFCNPEIENPMMRFELSSFSPLFADKILLTSLPCRYRGELTPKPSGSQIFAVARKFLHLLRILLSSDEHARAHPVFTERFDKKEANGPFSGLSGLGGRHPPNPRCPITRHGSRAATHTACIDSRCFVSSGMQINSECPCCMNSL